MRVRIVTSSSAAVGCTPSWRRNRPSSPHLHRDAEELRHLARVVAEDMHAEHLVGSPIDDDLHRTVFFAARERRLHRPEMRRVDVDHVEDLARFLLGQADGADLRRRENGRREYRCASTAVGLPPNTRVGKGMALADRDGREVDAVGHVADRIDRGRRWSCECAVDCDGALLVELDAGASRARDP